VEVVEAEIDPELIISAITVLGATVHTCGRAAVTGLTPLGDLSKVFQKEDSCIDHSIELKG